MAKFIVVRMDGKNPIPCNAAFDRGIIPDYAEPEPTLYDSARDADVWAKHFMRMNPGVKYQARPLEGDANWREREQTRLESGEYIPVPWYNEEWVKKAAECVEHFVHVSKDDPAKVAFTQNAGKGERDVQTRMLPSKYLKQFYGKVLNEQGIREWCARYRKEYGSDYELKFATEANDIEYVYENGPQSCMVEVAERTRAYAGYNLAVAYIERKGRITARTVVFPEKKLYCGMVYGDAHLLTEVLEEEGYQSSGRFSGGRMTYDRDTHLPSIEMAAHGYDFKEGYIEIR